MIPLLPEKSALPTLPVAGPGPLVPATEGTGSDFAALLGAALPSANEKPPVAMPSLALAPALAPALEPAPEPALPIAPRLPTGKNLPPPGAPLPPVRLAQAATPEALPGAALISPAVQTVMPEEAAVLPAATPTAALVKRVAAPLAAGRGAPPAPEVAMEPTKPDNAPEVSLVAEAAPAKLAAPPPALRPSAELVPPRVPQSSEEEVDGAASVAIPAAPPAAPTLAQPLVLAPVLPEALPGEAMIDFTPEGLRAPLVSVSPDDDPAAVSDRPDPSPEAPALTALPVALALPVPPPLVAAPRRMPTQPSLATPPLPTDPALLAGLAAAIPDAAARDDASAPQAPALAASTPPPALLAAASPPPMPTPTDRADSRAAPEPPAPQQQSTIDQVGTLREALRAQRPAMMLNHAEFGAVSLRLEAGGNDGWRAVLASRDPGFVPAIQAALAERVVAASTSAPDSGGASMGQQQPGSFQNGTGDHRSGSSPSGGQGSPQPYFGQSGSRDGEAAPDHRRPSTTAALAARVEAEDGGPGGLASAAGGLFA